MVSVGMSGRPSRRPAQAAVHAVCGGAYYISLELQYVAEAVYFTTTVGIPIPAPPWQGVSRPQTPPSAPADPANQRLAGVPPPPNRARGPDSGENPVNRDDCNNPATAPGWIDLSEVW